MRGVASYHFLLLATTTNSSMRAKNRNAESEVAVLASR
jgi:hypothetical protein